MRAFTADELTSMRSVQVSIMAPVCTSRMAVSSLAVKARIHPPACNSPYRRKYATGT